jgi:hypothetical protein
MQRRNAETLLGLALRLRAEAADLCALASELVDEADQLTEMAKQKNKARPEAEHIAPVRVTGPVRTH